MKRNYIMVLILVFTMLGSISSSGQTEDSFIASKFDNDLLELSDGQIDQGWENISHYVMVNEFGAEGFVKFANNESHLYSLFKVDSSKKWVALEFGAYDEFCMVDGNDGWTLYIDETTKQVSVYDELYTGSAGKPTHDNKNDLYFEVVQESGYHLIELVRAFDTSDEQDLAFSDGDLWNVKFASSTHHAKGGLDNPTEFGPSDIYYLSIQTGGEIYIPETPDRIDYDFWKLVIFSSIFIIVPVFIVTHFLVRQVFRPLSHPNQIVNQSFHRPTLRSRWNEVFGGEKKASKQVKSSDHKHTEVKT